jgi:hypothetical protein
MFSLLRPYIFTLDPEAAHDLAIKTLKFNFIPKTFFHVEDEEVLSTELFKKKLKNPIGLAAVLIKVLKYITLYLNLVLVLLKLVQSLLKDN